MEPSVYLIGETSIIDEGFDAFLQSQDLEDWTTDAESPGEYLAEFMGRLCYDSFEIGRNPNVTKIREGNRAYVKNLVKSLHGSVLEHAWTTWVFDDVSRVFTHELVRHRHASVSQESLRYVRKTAFPMWVPPEIANNPKALEIWTSAQTFLEKQAQELVDVLGLDDDDNTFEFKKHATSAMRRLAPAGQATTIGWSCNLRDLRHIIEVRTASGAEVEMRLVFSKVAEIALQRWPNVFADFSAQNSGDGLYAYIAEYRKV